MSILSEARGLKRVWDAVSGFFSSTKEKVTQTYNRASERVKQTYNNASQTISDTTQSAADTLDDVRHPLYTALRKGLSAIFGKAAMKWVADEVMNLFGHNNKDVNAFGSGTFMAEMQKWQRQLERDPEVKKTAPVLAPG